MSDGYTVDPDALRFDAVERFDAWSQVLDSVKASIPTDLTAADFSLVPGGPELYQDYKAASQHLVTYVAAGSATFDGFARRLLKTAQAYMEAEEYSAGELAQVQAEMDAL